METKRVLVTGGAGFIGSHIVDGLVEEGHEVIVFDSLDEQVHGKPGRKPEYLNEKAGFIKGDVRDGNELYKALKDVQVVFHEASAVGVGQSMYRIHHYVDVNSTGTAMLLDILANREHDVEKVLLAASMSTYGEGAYECADCGMVYPGLRPFEQMSKRDWGVKCPECGSELEPAPTHESKPLNPNSIYAIGKMNQEQQIMTVCKAYEIPCVSLRYFNVYGPRQSLSNPYTGVAAIFMSRIKNNNPPVIYEDGLQTRDFISIRDVVNANLLAMGKKRADYEVFNVGSGVPTTIVSVAETIARMVGSDVKPDITSKPRKGDVRHCYADMSKAEDILGLNDRMSFEDGMRELAEWSGGEHAVDKFDEARRELEEKGLA
ncbi:MAG: SDR family NAD(P)-dependent oxidoreductase [Candidatus Altiarchaeota archaeon]